MISSDVIRGHNDTIILAILMKNDSYGYQISKEITQMSQNLYQIKETTLYSSFTRLEKKGYIISYYGSETNGKRRTYYKITSQGIDYYQEKCEEWQMIKQIVDQFVKGSTDNGAD
ncbi:PadR family transcriptional regulator [Carnobacterium gallinarum]|uniref:PadR family transcriptional regulator n=1 Tax=Carnobacterium gallinarum TaxID=2749 RepID=UPI000551309F|nr:PadR family transcriptional regulator [Carnobacterium gallinarum]